MSPPFSTGFFASDSPPDRDFDFVESKYSKNVIEHILEHYEMNVRTIATSNINQVTLPRLLHYHVYGDYRLSETLNAAGNAVEGVTYRLTQVDENLTPNPELTRQNYRGVPIDFYPGNAFVDRDNLVTGLFQNVEVIDTAQGRKGRINHEIGEIPWLSEELNNTGMGARYLLPSIGTQIVKVHEFGNQSDLLKKAFRREMNACVEAMNNLNGWIPPQSDGSGNLLPDTGRFTDEFEIFTSNFDNFFAGGNIDDWNLDISPIPSVFIHLLINNEEYDTLFGPGGVYTGPAVPDTTELGRSLTGNRGIYRENQNHDDYSAVGKITEMLFSGSTTKFRVGDEIIVTRDTLSDAINGASYGPNAGSYPNLGDSATIVRIAGIDDTQNPPFTIEIGDYVTGNFTVWANEDPVNPGREDTSNPIYLSANNFKRSDSLNVDDYPTLEDMLGADGKTGDVVSGRMKQKDRPLDREALLFQRILFDTLATMQMLLAIAERYSYNNDEEQGMEELKLRYLSSGLNTGLKNRLVYEQYTALMPYTAAVQQTPNNDVLNRKPGDKQRKGFLDYLASRRAYYTLSTLITQRSKLSDKTSMDEFYTKSILLQEVQWMSALIGDTTQYALRKPEQRDFTSQLQYEDILSPGNLTPPNATAYLPKKTIFYNIETPLLKEIIGDYLNVYNQMTILTAYDRSGGANEKELAGSSWGSVRNRTKGIFDTAGIKPHEFFRDLFTQVNERLDRSTILKSHYPPSWLGDNTVQRLMTDPQTIGMTIEEGYYQKKFNEYIDHLGNVYKANYAVPLQIISTVERNKIRHNKDTENLRTAFVERLKNDNSKKRIKTTQFLFKPYGIVLAIMRAHLAIPFRNRAEFVAEAFETTHRDDIVAKVADPDRITDTEPLAPPGHPLRRP